MKLLYPFAKDAGVVITQTFDQHVARAKANGWCSTPGTCPSKIYYYGGIDWAKVGGCAIKAATTAPATVVQFQGEKVGYGMHVRQEWTEDGYAWMLIYAHLDKNSVYAKPGDVLTRGDVIGWMGWTGNVWPQNVQGTHLHFELRRNGIPVDPVPYLAWIGDTSETDTTDKTIPAGTKIVETTATNGLRLRDAPSTEAKILSVLVLGTQMEVVGVEGEWVKVAGWVSKTWVKKVR